jgi:hypothetical protein
MFYVCSNMYNQHSWAVLSISKQVFTTRIALNICKREINQVQIKSIQGELPQTMVTQHAKDSYLDQILDFRVCSILQV